MKKVFLFLSLALFALASFAQAPQKMSYQAVVRDAGGELIMNSSVGIRITIFDPLVSDPSFAETHTVVTNANGLATLEIGAGTVDPMYGTFENIPWDLADMHIGVFVDPDGGTNYSISGSSELLSVPYAIFAETAGNAGHWNLNNNDLSNTNSGNVGIGALPGANKLKVHGIMGGDDPVSLQNNAQLQIQNGLGTFNSRSMAIGVLDNGVGFIQPKETDVGYNHLLLNPLGATGSRVGIGTSNPTSKLHVDGIFTVSGNGGTPLTIRTGFDGNSQIPWWTTIDGPAGILVKNSMAVEDNFYVGSNLVYADVAGGNVGIGTTAPQSKLAVNGKITCKEVEVTLSGFPDYVFEKEYELMTLAQVAAYIAENGHLPNVPSAAEVEENGLGLGEMNKILLEKVEELTLHAIASEKRINDLEDVLKRLESLESMLNQE